MSDTEDYEALRQKNIAARNAFLQDFMSEIKESTEEIEKLEKRRLSIVQKENKNPKTQSVISRSTSRKRKSNDDRSLSFAGVKTDFRKKYNTRSRRKTEEKEESNDSDSDLEKDIIVPKKGLKVMFSWARPIQRDLELMRFDLSEEEEDDDNESSDEEIFLPKKKIVQRMSKSTYDPSTIPSPDEITQKMLDNVAVKATGKTYDAVNGTSCHQCRQKTRDTKTVCRSGECIGVRGQFCGPCLLGRYGESAVEALKDPHWVCPPCRNLCNCSICRTRNGQRPTGILAPIAKEEGYNSVKDYLQALDCEE